MNHEQQIAAVKRYTVEKLGEDSTGHGMDHINRVVKMAKKIAIGEGVDPFVPVAAAYLHDTIDEKLVANVDEAKEELWTYLEQHDFDDADIITIMDVIANISFAHTFNDLWKAFRTPAGWIAIAAGIAVAILSKYGVNQLAAVPQVTVALVLGTIIGVVVFKGVAAGPVIASGMTYCIVTLLNLHF